MPVQTTNQPEPHHHFRTLLHATLIFIITLIAFSWFLNASPLAGTEGHRVIPAHQMIQSGDYLVPRFWGVPYLAKPPLHLWILALSQSFFNSTSEWVYRFPSALSAALTALLIWFATRRWFGTKPALIAGFSFLTLLALWSQNGKADIDANHTFAVTLAAVGILELGLRIRTACKRSAIFWTILTTLAIAAVFLIKGPAGLPVILGIMIGPLLFLRNPAFIKRPHIWIALILATAIFSLWAFAVYNKINAEDANFDWMGISEVNRNISTLSITKILNTLLLPLTLFLYALPLSLLALLAWRETSLNNTPEQSIPNTPNTRGLTSPRSSTPPLQTQYQIIRILIASILGSILIAMLARLDNPRYSYIIFPLLCPIVGYLGCQWSAGNCSPQTHIHINRILAVFAGAIPVIQISLIITMRINNHLTTPWWMVAATAAVIILAALVIISLRKQKPNHAMTILVLLLISFSPTFAFQRTQKRTAESSYQAGLVLRQIVGQNTPVYSGNWIRNAPELAYYANIKIIYRIKKQLTPETTPPNSWILFQDGEYHKWVKIIGQDRFSNVTILPTRRRNAIIAKYLGPAIP